MNEEPKVPAHEAASEIFYDLFGPPVAKDDEQRIADIERVIRHHMGKPDLTAQRDELQRRLDAARANQEAMMAENKRLVLANDELLAVCRVLLHAYDDDVLAFRTAMIEHEGRRAAEERIITPARAAIARVEGDHIAHARKMVSK